MSELRSVLRSSARMGLIMGSAAVFVVLTGIVEDFSKHDVIGGVISLGHIFLFAIVMAAGYVVTREQKERHYLSAGLRGVIAGFLAAGMLALLALIIHYLNVRPVFVNATEKLVALLTFEQSLGFGIVLLLAVGAILGLLGGWVSQLPSKTRTPLLVGVISVLTFGILPEFFATILSGKLRPFPFYYMFGLPKTFIDFLFIRKKVLSPAGAGLIFALFAALTAAWPVARSPLKRRLETLNRGQKVAVRSAALIVGIIFLFFLPGQAELYYTDVIDNVGLYILMGLGLNIVIGFAGLLDLGYVAFFAIGAYTAGLLTSPRSSMSVEWSFWTAWPVALAVAALAGVLLGVPVLRMRGDYLAIVTLGFGEIIRVLALSDLLKPYFGGAQGILEIPKPIIGGLTLLTSQHLYYLILAGCLIAILISWRLSDSRVGRTWEAIREDEDVAEAMGINLVKYKLLAFAAGAAFSGLSGAIFASKLSSIYPHSFNLIISINVLCLIIIGGIASIPGVIIGALVLVGLPEFLRFAAEYRFLLYGATLVIMMLVRPEGFWPAARRQRELHAEAGVAAATETARDTVAREVT